MAINLHRCRDADKYGQLWVSSRGDYKEVPSRLYWLKPNAAGQMEKGGELEVPVSNMCIVGDSLYYIGVQWNETSKENSIEYGIVNVSQHKVIAHSLSSAPEIQSIEMPYGIIVNPQKKDFYLMDAKNYVSSGELLHFKADGTLRFGECGRAIFRQRQRLFIANLSCHRRIRANQPRSIASIS